MFQYNSDLALFTDACLNVTDSCNLNCIYCFNYQRPHFMTKDIALKCIDYLYSNIQRSSKKDGNLTFFGGEPMLMYKDVIVPAVLYTEEKYNGIIHLNITTNGTLLSKESIDFFKEHNVSILLSMDGAEKTQNMNRPNKQWNGSFDMVIEKVPYLLENFPNTTLRATVDQDTCENTFENYLFAISQGFKSIFMAPNCRGRWPEKKLSSLEREIAKIYTFISLKFEEGYYPPIHFSLVDESFKWVLSNYNQIKQNKFKEIDIERSPMRCGLGTISASFSFDGKIYGCQEQDSRGIESPFYIGDIFTGINKQKHKELLEKYCKKQTATCVDSSLCEECSLRYLCQTAGCPSVNIDLFDDFHLYPIIQCRWNQMFYRCAEAVLRMFDGKNNTFNNYLKDIYKPKGD